MATRSARARRLPAAGAARYGERAAPEAVRSMLDIAIDIAAALAARKPVVALESTIITHGMPFPRNLEMARAVEADVRAAGALPATGQT